MNAIEFHTNIINGSISIPEPYRNQIQGNVRVIVLTEDRRDHFDMIGHLMENPILVKDFKPLKREEIYEQ